MFTGIIEAVGTVMSIERSYEHARLTVSAHPSLLEGTQIGDSIAVNGVCLTAVELTDATVSFDAVYETMHRTALGHLVVGDSMNIERSLAVNGRFGGHIVQGHIEATGTISSIRQVDNSFLIFIDVPRDLMKYIVGKGSVAVDGISLTVVDAEDKTFSVSIIPHTWEHTNLSQRRAGDPVNIETDIIGKYVERMMNNSEDGYGEGRRLETSLLGSYALDDPAIKPSRVELL